MSGFDEKEKEGLISQDVIAPDGTIKPHALAAFKVLAGAEAYTRMIRILGTAAPVDKVTYFKDGVACSVDGGPGYFTVTFPALAKEAGFTFEEFTGSSRLLVGDALELASTLLITEYVFNLSYGRMISAAVCEQSECSVVFCGMHNLLYIDTVGDTVTVETISGSELLQMLVNLLQGPPVG